MQFIIKTIIVFFIINTTFLIKINAQVAVNNDGSDPDASAILDIKSTTSGFLVPRLTSAQRSSMPNKVAGLLVYDTDLQSYMLYDNSTWYNFRDYGSDANNNTRMYVEKTTDSDKIEFYRSNNNQFTIQRTGNGDAELVFNNPNFDIFIGRNTTGITTDGSNIRNVLIGSNAGVQTLFIQYNVIVGHHAATKNRNYKYNVIIGYEALGGSVAPTSSITDNVIMGYRGGYDMTGGFDNIIIGDRAGYQFNGRDNVVIGSIAGNNINGGDYNVIVGDRAGQNLMADYNVCIGESSGNSLGTGEYNVFMGSSAGSSLKENSSENVLIGYKTGKDLGVSGQAEDLALGNTIIGYEAGSGNLLTGERGIFIGYWAGKNEQIGGKLYIDNSSTSTPLIYADIDFDRVRIYGTLNVGGTHSFPTTNGADGQILSFDNSGNGYWSDNIDYISQVLTKSGNTLSLSGGGAVNLSTYEQSLSLSNHSLSISAGNSVDLSSYNQILSLSGSTLTISNGNSVTLPFSDSDMHLGNHTASQQLKTNGHWISNDGDDEGIYIASNGRIGINSSAAQDAILYVSGSAGSYNGKRGRINSGGCSHGNGSYYDVSIWATDAITADKFFATSDERIKDIEGFSDNEEDLATLMQIEIMDYTYIDTISKGNTPQKKVIAQQVKKVFSQAVTTNNIEVIPNIMQMGTIENGWVNFNYELRIRNYELGIRNSSHEARPSNYELKIGDKVKLVFEKHEEVVEVLEIKDDAFKVKEPITNHQSPVTVFIYGTQVNDFHIVDYDALSMLNVSATQALTKQNKKLKEGQEQLKTQLGNLEVQAAKINDLEAMVLEIKAAKEQ